MTGRSAMGAVLVLAAAFLSSCDESAAPSADAVRIHLERAVPGAEFRRDGRVRLGRFAFGVVKGALALTAGADRVERAVLGRVRRIDIASYEVVSLPDEIAPDLPPRLEARLARDGWYPMIRSREAESATWIFVREGEGGTIRNLFIVELDATELTVIDLAGKLDKLAAELVADDPEGFVELLGP